MISRRGLFKLVTSAYLAPYIPVPPVAKAVTVFCDGTNWTIVEMLDASYEKDYWGIHDLVDNYTSRDNYFGIERT